VCDTARRWLGTPWHHRARVPGGGVDCAQLLIAVYSDVGLFDAFDPGAYAIDQMLHSSDEVMQGWCSQFGRRTDDPQPGDAVLWRFGRCFSHAGIVLRWPEQVIHAFRPYGGVAITPPDASLLQGREVVFYTFW
jgi:cell wall-associated NlpC family hydrolase